MMSSGLNKDGIVRHEPPDSLGHPRSTNSSRYDNVDPLRSNDDADGHETGKCISHPCGTFEMENDLPEHNHDFLQTVAGIAGNVLEWYDFAVFGFFSDIIGETFFPPQAGHSQTVESFAVFGLAFLARPFGGVVMGYIGDVYGRKKALVISIFMMAFPTFAMGCLPSYERVGPVAIVLLMVTRLLQGLSVGGQLMSSLVYTLEKRDPSVWGLYGSFVMAAANFGTLLGNLVAFVLQNSMTEKQLGSYGWRIPFWSGILVSISGFYLKGADDDDFHVRHGTIATSASAVPRSTDEHHMTVEEESDSENYDEAISTAEDENANHDAVMEVPVGGKQMTVATTTSISSSSSPLRLAFAKENRRSLAASAMVPMLWAAGFYLSFVWMATYMKELSDHPVKNSFGVNAFSLLLSVCVFFPVAGLISDYCNRVHLMTAGAIGMGVLSPIVVRIIGLGHPWGAFAAQMVLGIALSFWGAPMCAWLVESFDPNIRLTSVAIGYNIAQGTAGGMSPALATLLTDHVGVHSPGWILTVLAIISWTGLRVVAPPRKSTNTTTTILSKRFTPIRTSSSQYDGSESSSQQDENIEVSQGHLPTPATDHEII